MKNKGLFALLTIVLFLSITFFLSESNKIFAATIVDSGSCGTNVSYTLDSDGLLTISGSGAMADFKVTSTTVDIPWYSKMSSIKSVVIEDGVTSIGSYACWECNTLRSVIIPNSVTRIGSTVFLGCSSLTDIFIPKNVTSIEDDSVFRFCGKLYITVDENNPNYSSLDGVLFNKDKTILLRYAKDKVESEYIIPDSVTEIGEGAFSWCERLTSVPISNSVTKMGNRVFSGCTSLTSVTISNSVTKMGNQVFSGCTSLTSAIIGGTIIGSSMFNGCTSLTSVTILDSVTMIDSWAFYGCSKLEKCEFPKSLKNIGKSAFQGCTTFLQGSITIPASVETIGENAFSLNK